MPTPIFTTPQDRDTYQTTILGTSGQGKSARQQAEARRLGITSVYHKALCQLAGRLSVLMLCEPQIARF